MIPLIAYRTPARTPLPLIPARRWRDWMQETRERFANRCLPLLMANEAGWWILNQHSFEATWSGEPSPASLSIIYDEGTPANNPHAASSFGYGVVTWSIPYVFRTPPGYDLLARGPANWPKHGACPLEGLVETDWGVAPFTMNWKLTAPGRVRFEQGEPICMIVPQRQGDLEQFAPVVEGIGDEPALKASYQAWSVSREDLLKRKFLAEFCPEMDGVAVEWEKHYFKGSAPDGAHGPSHRTKRRLRPFKQGGD